MWIASVLSLLAAASNLENIDMLTTSKGGFGLAGAKAQGVAGARAGGFACSTQATDSGCIRDVGEQLGRIREPCHSSALLRANLVRRDDA